MPSPLFRPPRHLVKEWPEVFEDLYMNTMPVAYLEIVHLEFANGRVWEINIKGKLKDTDAEVISEYLVKILQEYRDEIVKIDFKVNIDKLKKDIQESSQKLF